MSAGTTVNAEQKPSTMPVVIIQPKSITGCSPATTSEANATIVVIAVYRQGTNISLAALADRAVREAAGSNRHNSRYLTTRWIDSESVTISSTATELDEITVMRQSVPPNTPNRSAAVALQVKSGMNTHLNDLKISHNTHAITNRIAVPKVTRSERTKAIISAAIIGTPPTKISA